MYTALSNYNTEVVL